MSEPRPTVRVVDLPPALLADVETALSGAGFGLTRGGDAALSPPPDVVLRAGTAEDDATTSGAAGVTGERAPTVVLVEGSDAVVEALRRGAHDVLRLPLDPHELVARVAAAARFAALQAEVDELGGGDGDGARLLGPRRIGQHVEMMSSMARRLRAPYSVLVIDVDRLGRVNDEHGSAVGDAVIAEVGRRIVAGLRGEDVAGRSGGGGFVVLLPHTPVDGAWRLADRIRASVCDEPVALGSGRDVVVTVSGGCAEGFGDDDEEHLRRAREALAEAKSGGRNRIIAAV